jgi:nitroreductase
MELSDAIKGRRSIRVFKPQDVPEETVEKLIDAACYAPSAGNTQPWAFVIAKKVETKKKLATAAYNQAFVEKAPVVIVVCADENRCSIRYGRRGATLYCLQDTAAATQNILLTAFSLGLGTCWVGAFNEDEAKKAVNAPEGIRPVVMIPIGYANKKPLKRSRRDSKHIVYQEEF